jgi:superkiller protein 3
LNIIDGGGVMKRFIAIGLMSLAVLAVIAGCIPSELRTVKIEMGTVSRPRPNPDLDRVKRNLDIAVKTYPNNAEVFHYVGRVAEKEKRYADMAAAFDKSDSLNPKMKALNDPIRQLAWKELSELGKKQADMQQPDSALESFTNSATCWPERYDSWENASLMAARLGRFHDAYKLSSKAYAIAPDTLSVIEFHGKMCVVDSQYAEARIMFEKVLAKNPTNPDIMLQMADLCRSLNDTVCAINYFRQALEISKSDTAAWFDLGILYFQTKKFCDASESFQRVIQLAPSDKDAQLNLGLSLLNCAETTTKDDVSKGQTMYQSAKTHLEGFTAAYPDDCEGWKYLSNAYIKLKLEKEANVAFKKFLDCDKAK